MRVMFNLNFDDLHPETDKHIADAGGEKEKGILRWFFKIKENYPKIKATFFTTPNWKYKKSYVGLEYYARRILHMKTIQIWEDEPFRIDKHKEWCKWLNKQKFEIAVHGLHHYQSRHPQSAEFENLNYEEAKRRIKEAEELFKKSGLKYVRGFRPPGWGENEYLIGVLKDLGFKFISRHPSHGEEIKDLNGIVNIPQNWDIASGTIKDVENILKSGKPILAKGHIFKNYGRDYNANGLDEKNYRNVIKLLEWIEKNHTLKFVTHENIARGFLKE